MLFDVLLEAPIYLATRADWLSYPVVMTQLRSRTAWSKRGGLNLSEAGFGGLRSVPWSHLALGHEELLRAVPDSSVEIPLSHCETGCEAIGVVMGLGPQGMRLLRDSPFLFGRKFAHNASLPGFGGAMFGA